MNVKYVTHNAEELFMRRRVDAFILILDDALDVVMCFQIYLKKFENISWILFKYADFST